MILTWFWAIFAICATIFAIKNGTGAAVTSAALEGARSAVALAISIAGPICLWSGVGKLMERLGVTGSLSRLCSPVIRRLFPKSAEDRTLAGALSSNICANLLGLGNAATPMGIRAAKRLRDPDDPTTANDQLCRLVVMNTASIQLIPTTVAAVRSSAGCATPLDILPCVWVSSVLSVSAGLAAAWAFGRVWKHG